MLHLDILNTFFLCLLEQQTKRSEQNSIKHILWDGCLKGLQQSYRLGVNLKNVGSFCKGGAAGWSYSLSGISGNFFGAYASAYFERLTFSIDVISKNRTFLLLPFKGERRNVLFADLYAPYTIFLNPDIVDFVLFFISHQKICPLIGRREGGGGIGLVIFFYLFPHLVL